MASRAWICLGILTTKPRNRLGVRPRNCLILVHKNSRFREVQRRFETASANPSLQAPAGRWGGWGTTMFLCLEAHFGGGPADVAENFGDALVSGTSGSKCSWEFKSSPSAFFTPAPNVGYCFARCWVPCTAEQNFDDRPQVNQCVRWVAGKIGQIPRKPPPPTPSIKITIEDISW